MTIPERLTRNLLVKVLALLLASALWFYVTGGREAERGLTVPLVVKDMPAGFAVAESYPATIMVSVVGPRLLLGQLRPEQLRLELELRGLREGTTLFTGFEHKIRLPAGLHITRVSPAIIELRLVRNR
jgi:YbbR domain-containing protein